MGYKRGVGPWGLLGVHDLGPIWVHLGSLLFGAHWAHFGVHFLFFLGPLGPFGAHFILGPFGPYIGPRCYPRLGGLLVKQSELPYGPSYHILDSCRGRSCIGRNLASA